MRTSHLRIALSVGCPCGIGSEVAVVAAYEMGPSVGNICLVGDGGAIADAAARRGVELGLLPNVTVMAASELAVEQRVPGRPGPDAGRAQLAAVDRALDLVLEGSAHALVTGPVSKQAIVSGGTPFVGHTEHLQARTKSSDVVMLFAGPKLRTSLVTTHLAVKHLPQAVTRAAVTRTIVMTAHALLRDLGLERPRIVATGLNPHAGEGGLFGSEDRDQIVPGVADASVQLEGLAEVAGPMAAEAAFRQARDGRWDAVVAMYHDQATIASKLLDFGTAVNVTLGLPVIRTSVDHGTAYDIAGRGLADARGMRAAIDLALAMVRRRTAADSSSSGE